MAIYYSRILLPGSYNFQVPLSMTPVSTRLQNCARPTTKDSLNLPNVFVSRSKQVSIMARYIHAKKEGWAVEVDPLP